MSLGIFVFIFCIFIWIHDWARYGKNARKLSIIQTFGFLVILLTIVFPDKLNSIAKFFGIGRGVDFLIYPVIVWLFRESLIHRTKILNQKKELSLLVRKIAIKNYEYTEKKN